MANIAFKRGLQASLAADTFTPQDGTFYLTTDSHRLYVGQDNTLVDLNKYIKEVADQTALMALSAENGDFVYVKTGNMLVVCTDKTATSVTGRWTQVNTNTDTNTDQWLEYKSVTSTATAGDNATATITFTKHDKNVKTGSDTTSTVTIPVKLTREDLATALDMDIEATVTSGKATIKTSSGGVAQGDGFTITGGSNVTVSGSADALVISATNTNTTYDLTSPANATTIVLEGSTGADDVVTLKAGDQIELDGTTAGEITIKHGDISVNKTATNTSGGALSHGGNLTVVSGITQDDNGHVTGYATKTYTLPTDKDTTNSTVSVTAGSEGDLTVAVKDSANKTVTGTLDGGLYVTVGGTKVYNQGEITSTEYFTNLEADVEKLKDDLSGIDALRYRGTIGTSGTVTTLPTTGVQIGDTYKVATAGTYGGQACAVGDLLIATGTEGTDGTITGTIDWTLVAQGSDTDTTYTFTGTGNKITLKNNTNNSTQNIAVEGGTDISATVSGNTLTVAHETVTRTDSIDDTAETLAHGATIDVVTDIESSATGHITKMTTTKYKLPSDNNTTYTLPAAQVTADTHSKITLTSGGTGAGATDVVNFKADRSSNTSLRVSGTGDTITYEHTDYAYTAPTTTAAGTLTHGGKLQVVTGATVNNGHVTGLTTTEYTLPADNNTTYTYTGSTAAATVSGYASAVKMTDKLDASAGADSTVTTTVTSNSLKLTAGTNAYNIDLEWGTF